MISHLSVLSSRPVSAYAFVVVLLLLLLLLLLLTY